MCVIVCNESDYDVTKSQDEACNDHLWDCTETVTRRKCSIA